MNECSKSSRRRYYNSNFQRYFRGQGIDVGAGSDSLGRYQQQWQGITSVRPWDVSDGDAEYLATVEDNSYDFLHASHCLEHLDNPYTALINWQRVVKPGGYLVITVPDEDLYEQGHWPSLWSNQHYHSFTIYKANSTMPKSINVLDMLRAYPQLKILKVELIDDFYTLGLAVDQTLGANAECAIEIILQRL
jgi:predicted SAM-dependent methyltransferase